MTLLARHIFSAEHDAFRDSARRFFENEIAPFHHDWEIAGVAPQEIWRKAGAAGFLCTTLAEEYGGSGADRLFASILIPDGHPNCSTYGQSNCPTWPPSFLMC